MFDLTENLGTILLVASLLVGSLFGILWIGASIYRQIPPNRALIVYGWGGTNIVTTGGKLVIPMIQSCKELSLELMSFDVNPEQDIYTHQGIAVSVEAVAQLKVKSDTRSIQTAAEQFLDKSQTERENLIKLVMEGHLRGIVGLLTIEQIVKEPENVVSRVRETVAEDLDKMGLEMISFTIRKVTDDQDYISNMGRPDVAAVKRVAEIADAEAQRDIQIRRAETSREASVAQAGADQERVLAQSISETRQAEAQRDLNVKRAEYDATVNEQRALAEKAYEIAANQAQQKVIAEQVRIAQVEKQEQLRVQELEVKRREFELEAMMIKQANADQRRIEILAEAERQKIAREASGRAEAFRAQGQAEAEITAMKGKAEAEVMRSRGEAEAEVVRAKGNAEAEAMHKRADAYERYTEAAILDGILASLPQMAQAFSNSLTQVDKITIVSAGDGKNGPSALTGEVAKMVAQIPEVIQAITGHSIQDLMNQIRKGNPVIETPAVPNGSDTGHIEPFQIAQSKH
ncbi:MAG: SPFH domain-containing protein [Candidatus Sericytochromatia bacterium]|nr:SPFH domain-containing protein [Candidatus Sericytochromatia bacterium]